MNRYIQSWLWSWDGHLKRTATVRCQRKEGINVYCILLLFQVHGFMLGRQVHLNFNLHQSFQALASDTN